MSNIKGVRISIDEIYEYFDDYNIQALDNLDNSTEFVNAYIAIDGIQVTIHRSYKKDEYTKTKSKTISFCFTYSQLLDSNCYITFLEEKLNYYLTKLRDEVK